MKSDAVFPWSFLIVLSLTAAALNWVWEMLQMSAFVEISRRNWTEAAVICTVATLGDVVITLAIYGVGVSAAANLRWGTSGGWNVYTTALLVGGACAADFEWFSLATGRWSYTDSMPIVPVLKVGLWPFLQLTALVPLSFWIACWFTKSRIDRSPHNVLLI